MKRATDWFPRLLRRHTSSSSGVQWTETQVGDLHGITVVGTSPGIIWSHGLGGSCEADSLRGLDGILHPDVLGRSVLRLDLRGHGRSKDAHDPARGADQYSWQELAKDLRVAARGSLSRAYFGGEAMGAAVALHAAAAATATGSVDAPPGLVLMRPPQALASLAAGQGLPQEWLDVVSAAASTVEQGSFEALESFEDERGISLVDGSAAIYADSVRETCMGSLQSSRRKMDDNVLAAVLRGQISADGFGKELESLGQARHVPMASDAYGVPLTLRCPILILAVTGDPQHPVEAAEQLASLLPDTELAVAGSLQDAYESWGKRIDLFLRKAWMKEFLTKRAMPQ